MLMKCDELGLMIIIINLSNKIMSIRSLLTPVLTFLRWNFHVIVLFLGLRCLLFFLFQEIVSLPLVFYIASTWF